MNTHTSDIEFDASEANQRARWQAHETMCRSMQRVKGDGARGMPQRNIQIGYDLLSPKDDRGTQSPWKCAVLSVECVIVLIKTIITFGDKEIAMYPSRSFFRFVPLCAGFVALCLSLSADAQTIVLNSALAGTNEVSNGDPDGTGRGTLTLNTATGAYSWNISAFNILTPSAAHIHRAAAGVNGPVVTDFSAALSGSGTMTTALAAEIAANPAGFYFNVHTSAHPGGAIRGQLTTAALPAPAVFTSTLLGTNEVSNGDPDGSGIGTITIDPVTGSASWNISTANVDAPTGAHIHRAAVGTNGPVVFDFSAQLIGNGVMSLALAAEIAGNPSGFYFNVHTAAHPGGAVRGQLALLRAQDSLANVPTLSQWALIALSLAIAGLAVRRRVR